MQIINVPVEELEPYNRNNKTHPQKQIDQIAKSIELYGFNDPVGIYSDKNIIVEGHGRILAARQLGIKEIPCIRLDHLTDDERRQYAILHNQTQVSGGSIFDIENLSFEIDNMPEFDWNLFELDMSGNENATDEEIELKKKELQPYKKVHYLVSFDINIHDTVLPVIERLKEMEGVEIASTLN